jgi:hypothetical protein
MLTHVYLETCMINYFCKEHLKAIGVLNSRVLLFTIIKNTCTQEFVDYISENLYFPMM